MVYDTAQKALLNPSCHFFQIEIAQQYAALAAIYVTPVIGRADVALQAVLNDVPWALSNDGR